jgi:hypothetical protein
VLFGLLGGAVPARAFLLCWSMHLLDGPDRIESSIFGPYFVLPFGLAVAVLLLEIGLASDRRGVLAVALAAPVGLVALAAVGQRPDPVYQQFLDAFTGRLGGSPLFLALLASVGFYVYAALRRVPLAVEALTAALVVLAFVGPASRTLSEFTSPQPIPILVAAALQLGLGAWRRESWRCLLGAGGLAAVAVLALPVEPDAASLRGLVGLHLALTGVLIVGAAFDDLFARLLRFVGSFLVLSACLAVMFVPFEPPGGLARWETQVYPLIMAALLAAYGYLLGHQPSVAVAGVVAACWLAAAGGRGYRSLRQVVVGLDYLAVSLGLFALVPVSLAKSGLLRRWVSGRGGRVPQSTD